MMRDDVCWYRSNNGDKGLKQGKERDGVLPRIKTSSQPSKMTGCFFFLTIVLAQFLLTKGDIFHSVQEEGATATYHYQIPRQDAREPIRWFLTVSGRGKTLASCRFYSMQCTNNYPASFDVSFYSTFVGGVEYLYSDLTINSHNSSMTQLQCMDGTFRTTTWSLEITSKWPSQLICAPPTIEIDVIKVICSADSYPENLDPECSFDYTPSGSPLNYSVEFSRSRTPGPSCILKGRPNSGVSFSKTEYRFKAHMFHNNSWDVSSDWSPSITVELLNFTANGQRGAVVVNSGDIIQLVCSTDSDQPYTLHLMNSFGYVQRQISRLDGVISYRAGVTRKYSGIAYFCLAENSNPGHGILGDSIKIHVKGPLQLTDWSRNNTVYDTPVTSLKYTISGYPGPTSFTLRSRTSESPWWTFRSDFLPQCQENPSDIPTTYECSLFRLDSSMWRSYSSVDTEYMLEVSSGEGPSLIIAFTISRPITTTRTTIITTRYTFRTTTFPWRLFTTTKSESYYGSYSYNRNSSVWILGPVLGCSLPLVILLLAAVICYRQRKARRAIERSCRPTAAANGSSAPSSRPLISHSQMTRNPPVPHNVYITSSSGSFPYDQRPSSGLATSVNGIGVTDGRSLQQLDAPPPYDLAAVTHYGHGNASASGEQPGLGYSYLQYATPPPYDTVGKPKEPPPPYPGI